MINQIITESGIKGEYEVINNFSMKVWMTEPYQVYVHLDLQSGTFKNKEEIMNIPGIKEGVFSKISDNITV